MRSAKSEEALTLCGKNPHTILALVNPRAPWSTRVPLTHLFKPNKTLRSGFFFCCLSCCLNSYLTSTGPGGKRSIQPRARLFCEHSVLQKRNHLYHLKAMLVSDRGGRHMGSADKQEAFRMWLCPCWGLLSPLLSGLGLCCCSIFCFIAPLTRLLQSPAGGSVKPCLVPVLSLRKFSADWRGW